MRPVARTWSSLRAFAPLRLAPCAYEPFATSVAGTLAPLPKPASVVVLELLFTARCARRVGATVLLGLRRRGRQRSDAEVQVCIAGLMIGPSNTHSFDALIMGIAA